MKHLAVFAAMAVIDYFWARYLAGVAAGAALVSSAWSAGIVALGALVTVEYVHDTSLVFAATAGAFCGTYISVRRGKA